MIDDITSKGILKPLYHECQGVQYKEGRQDLIHEPLKRIVDSPKIQPYPCQRNNIELGSTTSESCNLFFTPFFSFFDVGVPMVSNLSGRMTFLGTCMTPQHTCTPSWSELVLKHKTQRQTQTSCQLSYHPGGFSCYFLAKQINWSTNNLLTPMGNSVGLRPRFTLEGCEFKNCTTVLKLQGNFTWLFFMCPYGSF